MVTNSTKKFKPLKSKNIKKDKNKKNKFKEKNDDLVYVFGDYS